MTRFNQTKCKKMLAIGFAAALLGSMGGHNSVLEAAVPDKVISEVPAAAAEQNAKTQRAEAKPDAKQAAEEENTDALVGEFDGFCCSSIRAFAVFRTLEDMYDEGLITESEYRECKSI